MAKSDHNIKAFVAHVMQDKGVRAFCLCGISRRDNQSQRKLLYNWHTYSNIDTTFNLKVWAC